MKDLQNATIQYQQDLIGIQYMEVGEEYEKVEELKAKEIKGLDLEEYMSKNIRISFSECWYNG